ncbi:RDD family protein [Pseudomonadales bacterium]|nr:RDD family protein [Pseudomonadales bacterium]
MPTSNDQLYNTTIAPLGRRLMAMLYDIFLLAAILLCTSAVYTVIAVSITGDFAQHGNVETDDTLHELNPTDLGWPIFPVLASVYMGFFVYFWRNTGQTLGMLVWKIKLVSCDETAISYRQALLRIIAAIPSVALLGLGYIGLLFGSKRQTWHDQLSKTKVIRLAKD